MTTDRTAQSNKPLTLIFLRQVFYLQQLRLVLLAVLLNFLLILVLIGMLVYFIKHPVHPIYFATDKVGRLMVEPPLNQPNMSLQEVSDWATNAVQTAYSYDFMNYRSQLQGSQKYFTDFGWRQYMKGLQASNNLLALTEHKMIVIAKVAAPPKLLVQGILGGSYAWKFEIPVLVTYYNPPYDEKAKFSNPLLITIVVQRKKLLESDQGLGIVQMIATLAVGTQPQEMTTQGG